MFFQCTVFKNIKSLKRSLSSVNLFSTVKAFPAKTDYRFFGQAIDIHKPETTIIPFCNLSIRRSRRVAASMFNDSRSAMSSRPPPASQLPLCLIKVWLSWCLSMQRERRCSLLRRQCLQKTPLLLSLVQKKLCKNCCHHIFKLASKKLCNLR